MDFWWGVIAAVLVMFAIGFMVAFVKMIMEIIRNIREEIRIDVQAILDHGFTSGMEKAAQIVREYRQASEAYEKETEEQATETTVIDLNALGYIKKVRKQGNFDGAS